MALSSRSSTQEGSRPDAAPAGHQQTESVTGPLTGRLDALSPLSAPRVNLAASDPARLGIRGRLNAMLGLQLAPTPASLEMRLRAAHARTARTLPDGAVVTVANVNGGVGKTPIVEDYDDGIAAPSTTSRAHEMRRAWWLEPVPAPGCPGCGAGESAL